jgi:uracil-DNA glycosylase family 4
MSGTSPSRLRALTDEITGCRACPRLVDWRERVAREKRAAFRDDVYWGRPVPGFGDPAARVLVAGLAPAAHGGNRTGRVFTGDRSGDWLFGSLYRLGFANQPTSASVDDGLELRDAYVAAAVRCAPPENKPTPAEIGTCRPFLVSRIAAMPRLVAVLALGRIAHDSVVAASDVDGQANRLQDQMAIFRLGAETTDGREQRRARPAVDDDDGAGGSGSDPVDQPAE